MTPTTKSIRSEPVFAVRGIKIIKSAAQEMISQRGYVVVGDTEPQQIGTIITWIWGRSFDHPFVIVADTDFADWAEQARLISKSLSLPLNSTILDTQQDDHFYRAVTD